MVRGAAEWMEQPCVPRERTRVYWRGVTLLEEHEIAPTYELYLSGCPLRCPFCAVPGASRSPRAGERIEPESLAGDLAGDRHPPFRAVAFVGGEPSLHLPWIRGALPGLRARLPEVELVLNSALCWERGVEPELATAFDWIVATVRCFDAACAPGLGLPSSYPAHAMAAAEAVLAAGGRLLLRLLLLPGHLDCCARPLAAWIGGLRGDLRARVMVNYAPLGQARGIPGLDRQLNEAEIAAGLSLLAPSVRRPAPMPLGAIRGRGGGYDPPVSLEIDASGRSFAPMVTGTLLPWLAEREPALRERLAYLEDHAR
jgi:putative pyruvate formate lyase activating enzyme